jgi:transposase-like protein
MLKDHLSGLSFKDLADNYSISKSKAYRICREELRKLPDNNKLTFNLCNRFSAVFEFDAKYINVKGYERKIAFLWGVDYERHDFPIILLARSESYNSWAKFCELFRIINHYLELIVCDDNSPLKTAARYKFPKVNIQTCYNHFKEGIRKDLRVRSDDTYRNFSREIDQLLSVKRSTQDFNNFLFRIYEYHKDNPVKLKIIVNIEKRKKEFLAFQGHRRSPVTTNMIEGFNAHLEQRLKHISCFNSFEHAKLWLNGYVLKRRTTKLTDCKARFRFLNGKIPLNMTKKVDVDLPVFF